jgi:Sec-independent protein translocase protein TatA
LPQLAKSIGQSRKAFKDGMRDAEEEEKAEKQLGSPAAPQINEMSDEALAEEMRRRAEVKG